MSEVIVYSKDEKSTVTNIKTEDIFEVSNIEVSSFVKSESKMQSKKLDMHEKHKVLNDPEKMSEKLARQDSFFLTEVEEDTKMHFSSSSHQQQQEEIVGLRT